MHEGGTYSINHIADASCRAGIRPAIWLFGSPDDATPAPTAPSADIPAAATEPAEIPAPTEG
jgi:hypothetical protein